MINRLYKVMGGLLPVIMVLAMAVMLLPANTQTAEAASGTLRFETVPLPKLSSAGNYVIVPETDGGPFAVDTLGSVFYAAANITDAANINTLLKSNSGGTSWQIQTAFRTTATTNTDNTSIVSVKLSPEYSSDQTVFVATQKYVYQSVDGGKNFSVMSAVWTVGTDLITDMDVTIDSTGRASVIVGTMAAGPTGDVYVYSPATTGLSWKAQSIGTYGILAVAFSPNYADDEGIFAVSVNSTTKIQTSFGYTQTGGGWGVSIGAGKFVDYLGAQIAGTTRARIAFPDDFDVDSTLSNIAFVGFVAGTAGGGLGVEDGDCYKVTFSPSVSSTEDMNVRGLVSTIMTATNIWSIDVTGDAEATTILVGTNFWSTGVSNYYWTAYISEDNGATWSTASASSPTGGTANANNTQGTAVSCDVLLAPDFTTSKTAYAITTGSKTSGLSKTSDGGKSWNQISLIDYANTTDYYTVKEMDVVSTNEWYIRLEYGASKYSSLWLTTSGGSHYERVYSYANPTFPLNYDGFYIKSEVYFLKNNTLGKFWRSEDKGATFPRIITAKAALTGSSIVNETTIYTLHSGGEMYYTENLGRPWVKPEESILAGSLKGISRKGNIHLVKDSSGKIYVSTDASKTYTKTLGATDLPYGSITFDPNFEENKYIYKNVSGSVGGGIWRIKFNEEAPDSTEWQQIDNITDAASAARVKPSTMNISGGIMYIFDGVAANVTPTPDYAGGIWRCTNPSADTNGTSPPSFARYTNGLANGDVLSYKSSKTTDTGRVYYVTNSILAGTASYYNQLLIFTDVLNTPVTLTAPANDATGEGIALSTTSLVKTVVLTWEALSGATSYNYQVANDEDFKSLVTNAAGSTAGQQFSASALIPGQTYYWRVRADEPVLTPWSETRTFTVASVETPFDLIAPARGAAGVDVMPVFIWTVFEGAIDYEVMVSEDPTFAIIDWSRSTTQTMYKAEEGLAYNTTYYWRVRGVTGPAPAPQAAPGGPWAIGIFTTMAKAVAPTPPVVIEPEKPAPPPEIKVVEVPVPGPAQAIPDYLLWIVIVVGAVLVIALIVLIVRTRRVT